MLLAAQLSAFPGITTHIVDRREGPLQVGQADGIACRTVEMFDAFGLCCLAGAGHLSPLPGATRLKPGSAITPFFGVLPQVVDASGNVLEGATEGSLVIAEFLAGADAHRVRRPPAFHGDLFLRLSEQILHRRRLPARRRRLLLDHRPRRRRHQRVRPPHGHGRGRVPLVAHPKVSEAAVVGYPHDIKGQGIYAYVTLMEGEVASEGLRKELVAWLRKEIGPIAAPDVIQFAPGLPKTRSGKIMRRILRKIAENEFGARSAIRRRSPIPRWSMI